MLNKEISSREEIKTDPSPLKLGGSGRLRVSQLLILELRDLASRAGGLPSGFWFRADFLLSLGEGRCSLLASNSWRSL